MSLKAFGVDGEKVRTKGVTSFGLVLGRLRRGNQDAIENLNDGECSRSVHHTWMVVCLGTDDVCNANLTMLSRYRWRTQGSHHNDAESWTSVTRLLVKDKAEARCDAATWTMTIKRTYAVNVLTTVRRYPCQCSSNGWVVLRKRS